MSKNDNNLAVARSAVDNLLKIAMQTVRGDCAVITIVRGGLSRVIAHWGIGTGNISYYWNWGEASFKPEHTLLWVDRRDPQLLRAMRRLTDSVDKRLFVRKPIAIDDDYVCALMIFGSEPLAPGKEELKLLDAVMKSLQRQIMPVIEILTRTDSLTMILPDLVEMTNAVDSGEGIRALLDERLNAVAISDAYAERVDSPKRDIIGRNYMDFGRLPVRSKLAQLFRRALETGESTPEVETSLVINGVLRHIRVRGSPFRPLGHDRDLIDIRVAETIGGPARVWPDSSDELWEAPIQEIDDTAGTFLLDTLVKKRTLRSRGDLTYLTFRSWRKQIKEHQIKALRAEKRAQSQGFLKFVGRECAHEVERLVGGRTFDFVVPVPCGHSSEERCLSVALAKAMAQELGIPVINAFAYQPIAGSSHPKTNTARPAMRLVEKVPGSAILFDDVATSGSHLQEAARLLKQNNVDTFATAWIGADAAE